MRTTAPPTATPTMAPVDSLLDEVLGGAEFVGVGIARVGVRTATEAF